MTGISGTLLPLAPSQEQRQELIANILAVYDRSGVDQRAQGMTWYTNAHDLAGQAGGGDYTKGAGVIAALSANTGWSRNAQLAKDLSEGKEVKHFSQVLAKVTAIMIGDDPMTVLGKGLKTRNFYRNMLDPADPQPVTVDRHAHDIARGAAWGNKGRGLSTPKRYDVLAGVYREAAALRGILPCQMQATTWCQWRHEHGQEERY